MMSLPRSARFAEHQHNVRQAAEILKNARQDAFERNGFLSEATRTKMLDEFKSRTGMVAYDWQLDVAEALLLGMDCLVIAGTGDTFRFASPGGNKESCCYYFSVEFFGRGSGKIFFENLNKISYLNLLGFPFQTDGIVGYCGERRDLQQDCT
jgi:hypothetical protein